ncbi:GNAT family N-acetyltransferase [Rhodococcus sp. 14C212]|nr:GNAT family N-acetyltransferase [Rhodococcus sp. 14C212]
MLVLARHAHAGSKKLWTGDDADRPLSPLGWDQACNLVTALDGVELHTLLSSPTARCRQTLEPLAAVRGLSIDEHRLLAPEAPIEQLFDLVTARGLDEVVLCTHGEVLTALAALARTKGATPLPPAGGTEKGAAWLIDRRAPATGHLRYLPPVPQSDGDGSDFGPVVIRPLAPGDEPEVRRLHEQLGERDAHQRFSALPRQLESLAALVRNGDERHVGLGAFSGPALLGVALYRVTCTDENPGPAADCAVVVAHRAQHHGVGTALIQQLTATARAHGVARLTASVPAENSLMLDILRTLGWSRTGPLGATVDLTIGLTPAP